MTSCRPKASPLAPQRSSNSFSSPMISHARFNQLSTIRLQRGEWGEGLKELTLAHSISRTRVRRTPRAFARRENNAPFYRTPSPFVRSRNREKHSAGRIDNSVCRAFPEISRNRPNETPARPSRAFTVTSGERAAIFATIGAYSSKTQA